MELLNAIFAPVVAFVSGFIGHLIAHDFCEVTPMLSRKIVNAAASILPASIRDRYLEEWRADLNDRPGTLAKLSWSIGCVLCARRLARAERVERMRRATFTVVIGDVTLDCDMPTFWALRVSMGIVLSGSRLPAWTPKQVKNLFVRLHANSASLEWRTRKVGKPDYSKVAEGIQHFRLGCHLKIQTKVDGKLVHESVVPAVGHDSTTSKNAIS